MPRHYVYRIRFADGAAYIGVTKNKLNWRVRQHKYRSSSSNSELHRRLNSEPFTAVILSKHNSRERAVEREWEEICRLEKPINVVVPAVDGGGYRIADLMPSEGE